MTTMTTMAMLRALGATAATMLALDLLWLGVIAKGFYARHMGDLLRPDVRWVPALLFYALYVTAVMVFVVSPAVERRALGRALALGAFFGLAAYATFDLTSLALIRNFPVTVVVADLAWGMLLTATAAAAGYLAAR